MWQGEKISSCKTLAQLLTYLGRDSSCALHLHDFGSQHRPIYASDHLKSENIRIQAVSFHSGTIECKIPQSISEPENLDSLREENYKRFLCEMFAFNELPEGSQGRLLRWCEKLLSPKTHFGKVEFIEDGTVHIKPGCYRRLRPPSDKKLAAAFYFLVRSRSAAWHYNGTMVRPNFYQHAISLHLSKPKEQTTTPLAWAKERAALAAGALISDGLFDERRSVSPTEIFETLQELAPLATNLQPMNLRKQRSFVLNEKQRGLIKKFNSTYTYGSGDRGYSEAVLFIIENSGRLTPANIFSEAGWEFFSQLPKLVENGLNVERVTQYLAELEKRGIFPDWAYTHAAELTCAIFGEKRPWWFKEDFSLVADLPDLSEPMLLKQFLSERMLLARTAKCAFEHVEKVYRYFKPRLQKLAGVSTQAWVDFTVLMVSSFGIETPRRSAKIFCFALQALKDIKPEARQKVLGRIGKVLQSERPSSVLWNSLEGGRATFQMPGILNYLSVAEGSPSAGHRLIERRQLDEHVVRASDLRRAHRWWSRPLAERIEALAPLLHEHFGPRSDLLALLPKTEGLLLDSEPVPSRSVQASWVLFLDRLHGEVSSSQERTDTASFYWGFFAARMPDPYVPPAGLLNFLSAYQKLPDIGMVHSILVAPDDRRDQRIINAGRTINRQEAVALLLECWALGVVNQRQLQRVFGWLTAKLDPEVSRRIALEHIGERLSNENLSDIAARQVNEHFTQSKAARKNVTQLQRRLWLRGIAPDDLALDYEHRQALKKFQNPEEPLSESDHAAEDLKFVSFDSRLTNIGHSIQNAEFDLLRTQQCNRVRKFLDCTPFLTTIHGLAATKLVPVATLEALANSLVEDLVKPDLSEQHEERSEYRIPSRREFHARLAGLKQRGALPSKLVAAFVEKLTHRDRLQNLRLQSVVTSLTAVSDSDVSSAVVDYVVGAGSSEFVLPLRWLERKKSSADSLILKGGSAQEVFGSDLATLWTGEIQSSLILQDTFLSVAKTIREAIGGIGSMKKSWSGRIDSDSLLAKRTEEVTCMALTAQAHISSRTEGEYVHFNLQPIEAEIRSSRDRALGLLPIGGKIHVIHELNEAWFQEVRHVFGLGSTQFKLDHASRSLVLPAVPSAGELRLMVKALERAGLFVNDWPELQLTSPGRLPPATCGIIGAAMMLATQSTVVFDEELFSTARSTDTGRRIMLYDAGGRVDALPGAEQSRGRTDILGRVSFGDAWLYQMITSVMHHDSPFSKLGPIFSNRLTEIFERHGLDSVLKASWVKDPHVTEESGASLRHFRQALKPLNDAWFEAQKRFEQTGKMTGPVIEVRNLFDWLQGEIESVQVVLRKESERVSAVV